MNFIIYAIFLGISIGCLPSTYDERGINLHNKKGVIILILSLLISILFSYQMVNTSTIKQISYITYIMLFISGIIAMAISYAENYLVLKHRRKDKRLGFFGRNNVCIRICFR